MPPAERLTDQELTDTLKAVSTHLISLRNRIGRTSSDTVREGLEREHESLISARNKMESWGSG